MLSVDSILSELQSFDIPKLSHQQCLDMSRPVTSWEIEDTIFQLGLHKASGPDGIPAFFFVNSIGRLSKSMLSAPFEPFSHSGSLFKPLNHTFLTVIPKTPFPDEVIHFRPISLCNVIYKTISKILVKKLKPFMDSLISPFQNAFKKGRSISNNILIAHEIMDILRKKKGRNDSFGALKIDMKKAYDRVSWNFLRVVLTAKNFSRQWINWLMECVTSIQYTLLVNGSRSKSFKPCKGLRQGDPFSLISFSCALIFCHCLYKKLNITN